MDRFSRRTFGKLSIAPVLAGIIARADELHAQGQASPAASPSASPVASPVGEMTDLPLATIAMAPGSENEAADPEGVLTLNVGTEVDSADPAVAYQLSDVEISTKVFASLLALNENNEVADCGADRVSVSADGRVYRFHIREGQLYSDGTPVTAEDYAYGIKRSLSPIVGGNYSNTLYAIHGSEAWRLADPADPATAELEAVVDKSIVALDDQTLQITLDYPAGYFPFVMCLWTCVPIRADLTTYEDVDWWRDISRYIGNGPFKVTAWEQDEQWTMERNEHYFRGVPGVKTLIYKEVTSPETELLAFQQGELDVMALSSTQLPTIVQNPELAEQLFRTRTPSTSYMWLNNGREPFNDVKVRQAFSFAINRENYIQQIANGVGVPAGSLLYEGIAGYQTEYQQHYDGDMARSLLAEAGYEGGADFPPLKFYYGSDSVVSQQQATYWSQAFGQELAVTVEPTPMDAAQLQKMRTDKDPELQIAFGYWYEDYPHPQNWLSMLFGEGSPRRPEGWDNQEFFDLLREADMLPIQEATPLYERADAILAEQTPYIFYLHGEDLTLCSPRVQGYVPSTTSLLNSMYQAEKIYVVPE